MPATASPARSSCMPAFNEEESVGDVVPEVCDEAAGRQLPRRRRRLDRRHGRRGRARRARIVATLPFNLGVGGAMRVGFRYALENGFDNVVQVDSDGQHDPAGVPALLERTRRRRPRARRPLRRRGRLRRSAVRAAGRWCCSRRDPEPRRRHASSPTRRRASGRPGRAPCALFAEHYPAEYLGDTIEALVIAARAGLRHPAGAGRHAPARRRHAVAQPVQGGRLPRPRRAWPSSSPSCDPRSPSTTGSIERR